MKGFWARLVDLLSGGLVIGLLLLVAMYIPKGDPEEISGAARAIDGDSLRIGNAEIRLQGIDAPEFRQTCKLNGKDWACGRASRDALRAMLRRAVTCENLGRDRFGRILGRCQAGDIEINAEMVFEGWAVDFGGYAIEEARARESRRGIWKSEFQDPQDWRDDNEGR